jgi:hypothetical protein
LLHNPPEGAPKPAQVSSLTKRTFSALEIFAKLAVAAFAEPLGHG